MNTFEWGIIESLDVFVGREDFAVERGLLLDLSHSALFHFERKNELVFLDMGRIWISD